MTDPILRPLPQPHIPWLEPAKPLVARPWREYLETLDKLTRFVAGEEIPETPANHLTANLLFFISGGVAAITTGNKLGFRVPFDCTITGVSLGLDQTGSIVVDIWKAPHADYPPTVADTITASSKPTISSDVKYEDTTLTGWTTSITAGDWLFFNVDSITTAIICSINLTVLKT